MEHRLLRRWYGYEPDVPGSRDIDVSLVSNSEQSRITEYKDCPATLQICNDIALLMKEELELRKKLNVQELHIDFQETQKKIETIKAEVKYLYKLLHHFGAKK
jgi:hypothetical protein